MQNDRPGFEAHLARFVADLEFNDLPTTVPRTVTDGILDTVAVIVAGMDTEVVEIGMAISPQISTKEPTGVKVPGTRFRTTLSDCTWLTGTAGHALDYDDYSNAITGHPSAVLLPTVLTLAQHRKVKGSEMIAGYVAGFEIMSALAEGIMPGHYEAGWHATSTFGIFGAVGTAAHLLELQVEEIAHALRIAASAAAGIHGNYGSMTKPAHVGHAAAEGLRATRLAANGFTGGEDAVSGTGGFMDVYAGTTGIQSGAELSLGDGWTIDEHGLNLKLYPTAGPTHSPMRVSHRLRNEYDLEPDSIDSVTITASALTDDVVSADTPTDPYAAKYSITDCVAAALLEEEITVESFQADVLESQGRERLRDRITLIRDPSVPYRSLATSVEIEMNDGEVLHGSLEFPPGHDQNPLSEDELFQKVRRCLTGRLSSERAATVEDYCRDLEKQDNLAKLIELLSPDGQ